MSKLPAAPGEAISSVPAVRVAPPEKLLAGQRGGAGPAACTTAPAPLMPLPSTRLPLSATVRVPASAMAPARVPLVAAPEAVAAAWPRIRLATLPTAMPPE